MDIMQNYLNNPQVQARMYQQQQPQQQPYNPVTAGSLAGMESARRSLDMDAQERQRAMGLAIARMGAGLSKPGYGPGFGGALAAINSNIHPAMQDYMGEEDKVADMKAYLLKQQLEMERHKRQEDYKRERDKIEDRFMSEKIGLMKDKVHQQEQFETKRVELMEKGEMPEDGVFFKELTPGVQQTYAKDITQRRNEVIYAKEGMKTINEMEKIIFDPANKHLWSSWAHVLEANDQKNPTMLNNLLRDMKKRDIDQIMKLNKFQTKLGVKEVKGLGAGRMTDIMKKALWAAIASGKMSPEAAKPILDDMKHSYMDKVLREEKKLNYAAKHRFYFPAPLGEEFSPESAENATPEGNDMSALSDDDLEKEIMSLQGG